MAKQLIKQKKAESWSQVLFLGVEIYLCGGATGICSWASFIFGIHK